MGGHTVNRDVGYGVHSYINLKILGGHVPVCPPYEYGPAVTTPFPTTKTALSQSFLNFRGKINFEYKAIVKNIQKLSSEMSYRTSRKH